MISDAEYEKLRKRVQELEKHVKNLFIEDRDLKDRLIVKQQAESQYGLYTALCIDTVDIWKQNRIRFFCPAYHDPLRPIGEMPWAYPVSSMGGFDDTGLNWVPPAGSTVCILFEAGQRMAPYYIGTTWHRNRGPDGAHIWGFNIDEYYQVSEGHRKGFLVGANDGSQVLPPWNTESYNGFDINSIVDFASDPEAQKLITYPNIYGFKTPEKHMMKMVDGDPRCNRRWKRIEIMSGCGNWMMFKDDPLHYAGQWSHPDCGVQDGDTSCIQGVSNNSEVDITSIQGLTGTSIQSGAQTNTSVNLIGKNLENPTGCDGDTSSGNIIGGHPSTALPGTNYIDSQVGANPFFKNQNECRPYLGPQTPQNNICNLPQTGIQFMSISGHTMIFDDSVEEPSTIPEWESSLEAFDFGCSNLYQGGMTIKSATGHAIYLSDVEDESEIRGENNYIKLLTASGNKIELNDHTLEGCIAGDKRGIFIGSTSGHTFEMHDEGNEQCSPTRAEGGIPISRANNAYVKIRTGYGLEFNMTDENSQTDTVQQAIQLFCPQTDNTTRGPHIMRMQEASDGPGMIFLRSGGNYIIMTYDDMVEIVGDAEENPADKVEIITNLKLVYTKDHYVNVTEQSHIFVAQDKILLLAGNDCQPPAGSVDPSCGPCVGPVLVYVNGCIRLSDRIYGTASNSATGASIFMMEPLIKCPTGSGCSESSSNTTNDQSNNNLSNTPIGGNQNPNLPIPINGGENPNLPIPINGNINNPTFPTPIQGGNPPIIPPLGGVQGTGDGGTGQIPIIGNIPPLNPNLPIPISPSQNNDNLPIIIGVP